MESEFQYLQIMNENLKESINQKQKGLHKDNNLRKIPLEKHANSTDCKKHDSYTIPNTNQFMRLRFNYFHMQLYFPINVNYIQIKV